MRPPVWLLLPFFLLYLGFWLVPLVRGAVLSLTDESLLGGGTFVGLANYLALLRDPRFGVALLNTVLYAAGVLVTVLPLALGLALLLNAVSRRQREIFQLFLLLPGLTASAALAILFLLVFNGPDGLLNRVVLAPFGAPELNWLQDPLLIRVGFVLQAVWRWTGLISFFLVTGLSGVAHVYTELAALEGASGLQIFRFVTLPLLRPLLFFMGLVLVFDAFVLFDGAYVLLGSSGGPADAGLLLVNYAYQTAFTFGNLGRSAAMSYALIPLLTLFVFLFTRFKDLRS